MIMQEIGAMPKDRSAMERNGSIARELRRQAGSPENRRHLQQLPQFRVEQELPDRLRSLLRELDDGEGRATRR